MSTYILSILLFLYYYHHLYCLYSSLQSLSNFIFLFPPQFLYGLYLTDFFSHFHPILDKCFQVFCCICTVCCLLNPHLYSTIYYIQILLSTFFVFKHFSSICSHPLPSDIGDIFLIQIHFNPS
jgi:hypothetical protein